MKNSDIQNLYILFLALLYGLEAVALTKRQEAKLEVVELRMLNRSDKAHVHGLAMCNVESRDEGFIGRRILKMESSAR